MKFNLVFYMAVGGWALKSDGSLTWFGDPVGTVPGDRQQLSSLLILMEAFKAALAEQERING